MQALSFSFENNAVRTLGTPETPLFVALDVCGALGHTLQVVKRSLKAQKRSRHFS